MSEPIIAKLWTIAGGGVSAFNPHIIYHRKAWEEVLEWNEARRIAVIAANRVGIQTGPPPIVRIPSLSATCDGPVVDESGTLLAFHDSEWIGLDSFVGSKNGCAAATLADLIADARRLPESCPHLRFEEMT